MSSGVPDSDGMHLRSINVTLDIATSAPDRPFLSLLPRALGCCDRGYIPDESSSYFVVAPYGTGKSLAATCFLQIVENLSKSGEVIGRISDRLTNVDSGLWRTS